MLMADGGGGGGLIPAFNAIVAGASRVVEREVSEPYSWAYDPERISSLVRQASTERDRLMAEDNGRVSGRLRTYVGGYNPWTGDVAAGRSGNGGCAEDAAACELGIPKNRTGFTKALQFKQGEGLGPNIRRPLIRSDKPVCAINCQVNTDKSQYEDGVSFDEGGRWDGGFPRYVDTFKIGVTAAKLGGRALLGLAIAGDVIDVATAPPGQRVQRAISDGASLAGAIYGGEIGAEIGSAAGPVGTVVGGLVGAAIGSGVAEKTVSWVGSLL
jgi:hypothetical protein